MGSGVGDIIKAAAPVVVGAVTGMPWLGAATGGLLGATGPQGSLLNAGIGGLTGYAGGSLGSGLGTAGSALANGSSLGDAFAAGFPSTANALGIGGASDLATQAANDFGAINGIAPGASTEAAANAADLTGSFAPGTSDLGITTGIGGGVGGIGAGGGSASSFGGLPLGSLLAGVSGLNNASAINTAEKQLQEEQQQNQQMLAPYEATGTAASTNVNNLLNPGTAATDLAQTPGYQFEKEQGENALNNQLAASGNLGSGAALKAAQQFGQGLAGTTYNTAVGQNLAAEGLGANAATGAANINTNLGNILAGGTMGQANNLTNTLANIANPQNAAIAQLLRSLTGQSSVAY